MDARPVPKMVCRYCGQSIAAPQLLSQTPDQIRQQWNAHQIDQRHRNRTDEPLQLTAQLVAQKIRDAVEADHVMPDNFWLNLAELLDAAVQAS